ncbi:(Lyso)-N-acylphosphatidylethanolamine lipase isoform X2 [Lepeophtheirus salmonis]|nr:(Lyso)-N-acylphosphatidylethanolamine lipase-like isoform X2 [Lepeophtheirus salmonis]
MEEEEIEVLEPKDPSPWTKWCKSSPQALKQSEEKIISLLKRGSELQGRYIEINSNVRIWTRELEPENKKKSEGKIPLVIIHGMGAGMALYAANAELLADRRKVILIDLPGFARSSRPEFSTDHIQCEKEYIEYIELWRKNMKIDIMDLLGHSFGGYVASSYSLIYPTRIKNLILVDPWGMAVPPQIKGLGFIIENIIDLARHFTPLLGLRVSGTLGLNAIKWFKNDLLVIWKETFKSEDESLLAEYLYHCNAQKPTGESAFTYLNEMLIWARNPMIPRLNRLDSNVNLTTIFGEYSWIFKLGVDGLDVARVENKGYNKLEIIEKGSHHLFLDNPQKFTEIVNKACTF